MKPILKLALLISVFHFYNNGYAQLSDSLYAELPASIKPVTSRSPEDSEKRMIIESADRLPGKFLKELNILAQQLITASEKTSDKDVKIRNMASVGRFYWITTDTAGMYYLQRVIDYSGGAPRYMRFVASAYIDLGDIYFSKSMPDSAMKYFFMGLNICKQQNYTAELSHAYTVMCDLYITLRLFDKAAYYNNLAFKLIKDKWSDDYISLCIYKMRCYKGLYSKTGAMQYADTVIAVAKNIFNNTRKDSMYWYGSTYLILGQLYYAMSNYKRALDYYDSSLLKQYREKDKYYLYPWSKNLYRDICLIRMGHGNRTIVISNKGSFQNNRFKGLIYEALYNHAADAGKWQTAFTYYKEYSRYLDSMNIVGTSGLLAEAEQKFAITEKQAQITALENKNLLKEKKQSKLITIGISAGLVLLLAIAILIGMYRYAQVKRHSEKQLLTAELYNMEAAIHEERQQQLENITAQRKKIAEDMHDEVSSSLAAFRFYIIDLKAKAKNAETIKMLSQLEAEAQVLYQQARDFMKNLNANKPADSYNVYALAEQLSTRFSNEKVLVIKNNVDRFGVERYFTGSMHYELYLVIKEAVANSIKHAGASFVDIGIYFKNHTCFFIINDNGKGFNMETVASDGLGLKSIANRIQSIRGNLQINSSGSGTVIEGFFPV